MQDLGARHTALPAGAAHLLQSSVHFSSQCAIQELEGLPRWLGGQESTCQRRRCEEEPLEQGMAPHSRILAWIIPWTEEPGGLQSTGSHRHD